jgi:hypothetical protein
MHLLASTIKVAQPRKRAADPADGVAVEANHHGADSDGSAGAM